MCACIYVLFDDSKDIMESILKIRFDILPITSLTVLSMWTMHKIYIFFYWCRTNCKGGFDQIFNSNSIESHRSILFGLTQERARSFVSFSNDTWIWTDQRAVKCFMESGNVKLCSIFFWQIEHLYQLNTYPAVISDISG